MIDLTIPVVLHYINCGFSAYHRKYQRLVADSWLGVPIPFKFYTQSRRLTGDFTALSALYDKEVLFDDHRETEYLIAKGILTRVLQPSSILSRSGSTTDSVDGG